MKIFLCNDGDRSVGIQGEQITIDWPGLENIIDDSMREALVKDLHEFGAAWMDMQPIWVQFEDQCPDCSTIRPQAKESRSLRNGLKPKWGPCINPTCPNNIPEESDDWERAYDS